MNGCCVEMIVVAPKTETGLKTLERAAEKLRNLEGEPEIRKWMLAEGDKSDNKNFVMNVRCRMIAEYQSTLRDFVIDNHKLTFSYVLNCFDEPLYNPIQILSTKFPGLVFKISWTEGCGQFAGWLKFKGGRCFSQAHATALEQCEFDLPQITEETGVYAAEDIDERARRSQIAFDEALHEEQRQINGPSDEY